MASVSKNVYIDKLDAIVNKYGNTFFFFNFYFIFYRLCYNFLDSVCI